MGMSLDCLSQAVVFLVGLNGYNQRLFEDNSVNKMHESLKLFKQVRSLATEEVDPPNPLGH